MNSCVTDLVPRSTLTKMKLIMHSASFLSLPAPLRFAFVIMTSFNFDVTSQKIVLFNPALKSDSAPLCGTIYGNDSNTILPGESPSECALNCIMNAECRNFNYNASAKNCELFTCPPFSYAEMPDCAHFSVNFSF